MSKWDLQWSVSDPDVFVAFSSDKLEINLHRLVGSDEVFTGASNWQQKQATKAELYLRSKADLQSVKCFAICPNPNSDNILALGLSTGKVVLTAFNPDPSLDKTELVGCEINPKHPRQCTGLTWNQTEHKLIAVSYDRHRPDQSLAVYDVYSSGSHRIGKGQPDRIRPVAEFGTQADVVNSVAWLPHNPTCLVAGFAGKTLKKFDLRDPSTSKSVITTKGVHGLVADPLFEHQLASFVEEQIYIWDLRNFDKPVLSIKEVRTVGKLEWNPNRKGVLMSLPKDSSAIKLYQLEHVANEMEYTERLIQPLSNQAVCNFAMHPTKENNMVVVSPAGHLKDFTVQDIISVSLSPHSACSLASSRNLLHCSSLEEHTPELEDDISIVMKKRAIAGYGIQKPLSANLVFVRGQDVKLRKLWSWMNYMRMMKQEERIPLAKRGFEFYGIKAVIKGEIKIPDDGRDFNQVETVSWDCVEDMESKVYRSKERSLALKICGWPVDSEQMAIKEFIDRVCSIDQEGTFERAACIAVFHLKIRLAIEILNKGAKSKAKAGHNSAHLNAVAMALAGLNKSRTSLWCEMVSALSRQLDDPYLRAMFSFMTSPTDTATYDGVLHERDLQVEDRLGFACLYLNDHHLNDYLDQLSASIIRSGNLAGVLVTGLSKGSGLDLLQSYVDQTGDVQSVSCVMLQASDLIRDKKVEEWMEAYRTLLDTWRLWHQRAKFDMCLHATDSRKKVPEQTYVNCHYCSNPITPSVLSSKSTQGGLQLRLGGRGQSTLKPKACYVCRKPLPRCSLCQMNMGTSSGTSKLLPQRNRSNKIPQSNAGGGDNAVKSDFDIWFTWCQSCRHGGHGCHLLDWFSAHSECPVTGCACKCMQLDTVGAFPAMDTSK